MYDWRRIFVFVLFAAALASCAGGSDEPRSAASEPTQVPTSGEAEIEEPTEPPSATSAGEGAGPSGESAALTEYALVGEESMASFELGEILAGRPNQVVGTTRDVEGEFRLDFTQPAATEFGAITIDANTLITDDDRRNGAIRRFILETGREGNESIVFQPLSADGLPASVEVGATYPLSLSGELTIHGVSSPATFEGEVAVASADRIEGSFETTVRWSDYGLSIPQVPSVADVDEEVKLSLDFVAIAQ